MRPINTRPSQLWEQWIARLHGVVDPQKDYFRLELLQLLARCEISDRERFLHRFGTILNRSLKSGTILVVERPSGTLIYANRHQPGKKIDRSLTKRLSDEPTGLVIRQFPRPWRLRRHDPPVKSVGQLRIGLFPDNPADLVVLAEEAFDNEDRRFLHFVAGVVGLLERQVDLSRQLSREQKLIQSLTQNLSEGLALFDGDGRIIIWNRPLQRMTGFSPKDAQNKTYDQVLRFIDRPLWLRELIDSHQNNPNQSGFLIEGQASTGAKQSRWLAVSGSFLRNDQGRIEQAIVLVRDISHRKELEQRKNEFISIATHELRTPITVVKGYLSLLAKADQNLTDKQQQYITNATLATERLVKLAEDLLQVTRLDEDRMQFTLQPVQLTNVIEKVCHDFREKASKKQLAIHLTLPPFPTTIIADSVRLEQVFANLVDNAIKYTEKGAISIGFEYFLEKLTQEEKVTVVIKDTGIGIDSRDLEEVFEKFHRTSRAATSREPGAGLGLYIVKSFVDKLGGKITVNSRPRRGSSFAVTFPIAEGSK
ncbi:MAG: ATP-binding protein [Patescibacteria group bacterium]